MPSHCTPAEIPPTPLHRMHRAEDHPTSVEGAKSAQMRAGTQKAKLLRAYGAADDGLIAEQAGNASGLSANRGCCYWKRCGELRMAGLIVDTGEKRLASTGQTQMVSKITDEGRAVLAKL